MTTSRSSRENTCHHGHEPFVTVETVCEDCGCRFELNGGATLCSDCVRKLFEADPRPAAYHAGKKPPALAGQVDGQAPVAMKVSKATG